MTTTITEHVDTWESGNRHVSVTIEEIAPEPAAICVTFGNACETWDDLTAEEARELGTFLADALGRAADQLEARS